MKLLMLLLLLSDYQQTCAPATLWLSLFLHRPQMMSIFLVLPLTVLRCLLILVCKARCLGLLNPSRNVWARLREVFALRSLLNMPNSRLQCVVLCLVPLGWVTGVLPHHVPPSFMPIS